MRTGTARHALRGVAAVVLAAAVVSAPTGAAAALAAGKDLKWTLQGAAEEIHELGITGVQAAATRGHRPVWAGAGVGDRDTGAPVPYNGYFRMGSNTKTFAAVVVLQLVEEGELSLDDPVERWLPGVVRGNGHDGAEVTVRQLLQHTSGIYNYTRALPMLADREEFYEHRFEGRAPQELVEVAMAHEPEFPPGTGWSYSNTNYVLAGMIIEEITGQSWPAAVYNRVVRPLGLRQTFSPGEWPHLPQPHATAYQQWAPDGPLTDATGFNPSWAYAAGDMVTTPRDLLRFWRALLGGELLGPEAMAELQRTVPAEEFEELFPGVRYGLGIMWLESSCGGYWAHGGDVPGMSTSNGVTPDGDRAVVVSLSTQLADPERVFEVYERTLGLVDEALCT